MLFLTRFMEEMERMELRKVIFEYLRIPYTHSGVISSFNAMDKSISKKIFIKNKIKTPKFFSIKKFNFKKDSINKL